MNDDAKKDETIRKKSEETEVTIQISVPEDGGWGWVVVAASFLSMLITYGEVFTFGALVNDISTYLGVSKTPVTLINSVQTALFFIMSPFAAAFINRHGFRACAMLGSIVTSFALLLASFSKNYQTLLFFYGIVNGIGCSYINMATLLVVGFYFEKNRGIAVSIAASGQNIGVMAMFPLNSYLVNFSGWKNIALLQAGQSGLIYFLSFIYRPLLAFTVTTMNEKSKPTRIVARLPELNEITHPMNKQRRASATERFLGANSNRKFPTAAAVVEAMSNRKHSNEAAVVEAISNQKHSNESAVVEGTQNEPKKTLSAKSIMVLRPTATSSIGRNQLEKMQSRLEFSNCNVISKNESQQGHTKKSFWRLCFNWEKQPKHSRPIYRDDTFYIGEMKDLPRYRRTMSSSQEDLTGLEYQMAVSRTVTVADLKDRAGFCSEATKRVLASMLDNSTLLKKPSFLAFCASCLLCYVGMLVPYVFLTDRNREAGISSDFYVSVIEVAALFGRVIFPWLVQKSDVVIVYGCALIVSGISTILSNFVKTYAYQYAYSLIFGISLASLSSLRCVYLVKLYGLSNLTNSTGSSFIFIGIGSLISAPLASTIKEKYGYSSVFYVAGVSLCFSGLLILLTSKPKGRKKIFWI